MANSTTARFVVLEHTWNGVHWDFLLEVGPTLKTWAVTAPIVPGVNAAARLLGDHRPIYLTYEGPVSGGRGSVRRVAGGTYRTLEWSAERIRVLLAGAQLVGEVELYWSPSGGTDTSGSSIWTFRLGKVI